MRKEVLDNGIRLLYEYRDIEHSSFCIGLEAGANEENKEYIGVAHALEHFLFKGTEGLNEEKINKELDRLFGFSNAMTNFPYVIYYGTTYNEDFEEAFSLYSDIILKPKFSNEGFKEEIAIIKQELLDWQDDLEQFCEDNLLKEAIKGERLNCRIIGTEKAIDNITIKKLKEFYKTYYVSENMVISVVTSLDYQLVKEIVSKKFGILKRGTFNKGKEVERNFVDGIYHEEKKIGEGVKIQFIYDINNLSLEEVRLLKVLNMYIGEGVSSILYDEIRTKLGLAYEISSTVKWEKGIKLFSISISTSKEYIKKAIDAVNSIVEKLLLKDFSQEEINNLIKRYRMKSSLEIERSIVLANRMAINEVLNLNGEIPLMDAKGEFNIKKEEIKSLFKKVFVNKAIGILS